MNQDELTLPNNLEAERAVLGSILVHSDAFELAAGAIGDDDWYRDAHRRVWRAMKTLNDERVTIDFVTLRNQLNKAGDLDHVGGPAYISSLADGVPRSTNVRYYADIIHEKSQLRGLIAVANTLLTRAYAGGDSSEELAHMVDRQVLDIQNARSTARLARVRDSLVQLTADLEVRMSNRGALTGLSSGFPSLDALTMGWQRADLIVIAARPSIGKTAFAMNAALSAARAGAHVAVFSLEMRRRQLEHRLLSSVSGVALTRILSGHLGQYDFQRISAALQVMHDANIAIDDRAGQTVWDIRSACRRLKAEGQLDLVIVDYVQLMPGTLDRRGANRNEEVTDISRRLKVLADEVNAPVLLLSQLSRAASKRADPRPQLSDLRESGALEQDADVVGFLHREDHKASGTTEFILEKQRNGPTGTIALSIERNTVTFTDGAAAEPALPYRGDA